MEVTNAMIRAAVNKAVESGLLARNAAQNAYDWEIMRGIVAAALGASGAHNDLASLDPQKTPANRIVITGLSFARHK